MNRRTVFCHESTKRSTKDLQLRLCLWEYDILRTHHLPRDGGEDLMDGKILYTMQLRFSMHQEGPEGSNCSGSG